MGRRLTRAQRDAKAKRLDRCGPTGKVRYRSENAARESLKTLRGQRRTDPARGERRAYKCWSCAGWHLTKQAYGEPRGDHSRELPAPDPEPKEA